MVSMPQLKGRNDQIRKEKSKTYLYQKCEGVKLVVLCFYYSFGYFLLNIVKHTRYNLK